MAQIITNPPFDNRVSTVVGLQPILGGPGNLERGSMVQEKQIKGPRYGVNFLYNPSVVMASHQTDPASSPPTPQAYRNPLDKGAWNVPLMASVSFNLLFDRTYEMWDKKGNPNSLDYTRGPSHAGVRVDVESVYRTVGILQPTAVQPPTTAPDKTPSILYSNGSPGPMPLTPVTVYFGGTDSLRYRGYVSSLDIQWTHFSQLMVPMRCTVGVSMNMMTENSWQNEGEE